MANSRKKIVPIRGRFGRRQPPYTRLFRGPRRRLARSVRLPRFRPSRWVLPWLPFLGLALYDLTFGDWHPRGLFDGLSAPADEILLAPAYGPAEPDIAGLARVVDGDTLKIGRIVVRIDGIDAPEARQTCTRRGRDWRCGAAATARMVDLAAGRRVECVEHDTDRYGRKVARCRVDGRDLGAEMVRAGLALAYRHYSTRYVPEENEARTAKRGVWAGEFTEPWAWKRGK